MLNKKRNINVFDDEDIKQKYDELKYKYEKVISENAALKLELNMYKGIVRSKFLEDIKNKVIEDNTTRDEEAFREKTIFNLKTIIKEKELEILKLKGKTPNLETPQFNKIVNDKIVDDTFVSLTLYKSFKIIQFHAIKNSVEKVGVEDKTIKALLNLAPDKVFEKEITPDELSSFSKYFPAICNFIKEKVEKDYNSLTSSGIIGYNMRRICEIMNYVFGEEYFKEIDIKNIENFSNKIIK